MSIYLRGSLRAGPFRFNLSRSGIGVSVGIPGFRVGAGPQGNYVRVGGLGTYYASARREPGAIAGRPTAGQLPAQATAATRPPVLDELDGVSVQHLAAAHPTEMVAQIQAAARRIPLWPFAAIALVLAALLTAPYGLILLAPGAPGLWWLRQRDIARRSVVVFYEVDDEPAERFGRLVAAHSLACRAQRVWAVEAQGNLHAPYERKVNAGASSLIRRSAADLGVAGPAVLVTNISVPSLRNGNRSVYFLPDRMLLQQGKTYSEIGYASLCINTAPQRFIEDGRVPTDSQIVSTTWQYANAKGGPDRRFKNNRQLPVMLYGRLTISNPEGLLMVWDFSNVQVVAGLAEALQRLARCNSRTR